MSSLWLYVPPVILLVALVGLAVMLGKKTAAMKKIESLRPKKGVGTQPAGGAGKLKKIGKSILKFLERLLFLLKVAFRKGEEGLTNWLRKRREKRLGKTPRDISDIEKDIIDRGELPEGEITFISETGSDDIISGSREMSGKPTRPASEVVVRRKPEAAPVVIKEQLASEDKAKEDALIHRIAENPKDMEAYRELGDYYMSIGNIKDAKDSFKMVLKLRPRDLKAKSSLREIEMKMRLGS